jgi:hypothetical protein
MPIGGNQPYPAIQDVTNLVRSWVQDDMKGATATLGEGQLFPDDTNISVTMMNCFSSALRIVCRKLRMSSGPMLIKDNILVLGIPPLNSPTQGLAAPDPGVQVQLSYVGFYDGSQYQSNFVLPIDCIMVDRVWEKVNGSNDDFQAMEQPAQGLYSCYQNIYNRIWEWRQDSIWMPGSIETMDLRLRYQIQLPSLFTSNIDPSQTFIPINDCQDTVAAYTLKQIALRQGAQMLPGAMQWADEQINDFLNEIIRRDQGIPYPVRAFGEDNSSGGNLGRY